MEGRLGLESNVITTHDNWTGLELRIWLPITNLDHMYLEEHINNQLLGATCRILPRRENTNAQPQMLGAPTNIHTQERELHSNDQNRQQHVHVQTAGAAFADPVTTDRALQGQEQELHSNNRDRQHQMAQFSIPADEFQPRQTVKPVLLSISQEPIRSNRQKRAALGDPVTTDRALQAQEISADDADHEGPSHRVQGRAQLADKALAQESIIPRKQLVKGHRVLQTQQKDHVSIQINNLADAMRGKLKTLHAVSDCVCIYRVPEQLRDLNDKAYTPHSVSIGPFHHGEQKLELMEDEKIRYVERFLLRSNVSMEELFKETLELEPKLRNSYAEKIEFISQDFVTIMLVDGVFILEYLLRRRLRDWEPNDPIFNKQRMTNTIRFDLLLLENQIPYFFLDHLFRLSKRPEIRPLSTIKLLRQFLEESTGWDWFVKDSNNEDEENDPQHILDFLSINLLPPKSQKRQGKELKIRASPSIVELHSAGVKFVSSSDRHFLDIQFVNGVLTIPTWKINDRTELLFRNLLAYEQCNPPNHYMSDYIAFMDMLIDVDQDVELLVRKGIIENLLQDNQSVADLVNNLSKNNVIYDKDFYFSGLVEELKSYCERPWHKWKANLKQEYFKNPWTIISVIAAVVLLLLTILQSVCSVLQVK